MAIEISNAIHAMAIVTVDERGGPMFVGQGNVGFAAFGTGPDFSEQLSRGRYRMHMLSPISIATPSAFGGRGEGMVFAEALQPVGQKQGFPLLPPVFRVFVAVSGLSDILIETTNSPDKSFGGPTGYAEVTEDTTINAAPFADLLTVPITLPEGGSGILEILATASAEGTLVGSQVNFQLTLDGTAIGPGGSNGASFTVDGSGEDVDNFKGSIAILKRVTGVAAGDHTVKLQWKVVGAMASAKILITSGFEHASLRVTEQPSIESDADDNITAFQVMVLRLPQQSTG
jgi:hypothetical protein